MIGHQHHLGLKESEDVKQEKLLSSSFCFVTFVVLLRCEINCLTMDQFVVPNAQRGQVHRSYGINAEVSMEMSLEWNKFHH